MMQGDNNETQRRTTRIESLQEPEREVPHRDTTRVEALQEERGIFPDPSQLESLYRIVLHFQSCACQFSGSSG
ncbi:hypothetical protein P3339_15230 [Microbulbifer sp. MLAF003]|uniref:hypothetical protein n=1 Tax=Microbulbifer sp. MLAF003 TaxID=3032582 RepID=UPI0024AD15DF|nr:hypothetical protein [Microbulbifer sp. MLAF003]WHI49815.1 hypothetical protein P3339_15230 [Microbulbifer sp. MLAF003]